jgi:hypothetical protein
VWFVWFVDETFGADRKHGRQLGWRGVAAAFCALSVSSKVPFDGEVVQPTEVEFPEG